jgi:hypothetical protein
MNLQEFLSKTCSMKKVSGYSYQEIRPRIICNDGQSLSVQASDGHYSHPRLNGDYTFSEVEVGYPSIRPSKEWERYFDGGKWNALGILGFFQNVVHNWSMILYSVKNKSWKMLFSHYLTTKDNATNSVYGYIPVELVEEFINSHGGIDQQKTFAKKEKQDDLS